MNKTARLFAILSFSALASACDGEANPTGSGGTGGDTTGGTGGTATTSTGGGGTGGDSTGGTGGTGGTSTGGAGGGGGYTFTVTTGFNTAESCLWDPVSEHWYVSNIAPPASGNLLEVDGEGWISRLDKDGVVVDEKWVSGFNTPAGLRVSKGVLYVNDLTKVHGIDVATAAAVEEHTFPSAILLNDPAIDEANGIGYAADTFGNAIYQFKVGDASADDVLVASAELQGPNGLLFEGGKLYVASLVDFDPANLGPFLSVDVATKAITQIGTTLGKFDGLEKWQGGYLLSDNGASKLVLFGADGTSEVLFDLLADQGFAPAADIGVDPDRGIICIPNLGDSVAFLQVN